MFTAITANMANMADATAVTVKSKQTTTTTKKFSYNLGYISVGGEDSGPGQVT